jgi:hypothetical protein
VATATLLSIPLAGLAQEAAKIPDSVAALAAKYDETRKRNLGPLLDAFAAELKTKVVPDLTRAGKADIALQIDEAAGKLTGAAVPLLPREGASFPKEAFAAMTATPEWQAFMVRFTEAETTLNTAYQNALDREKTKFQNAGDPRGVLAVESEGKRVAALSDGSAAAPPAPMATTTSGPTSVAAPGAPVPVNPTGKKITRTQEKQIEEWLIGKMWRSERGKPEDHFFFRESGEVVRDFRKSDIQVIHWLIEEDGAVNISGSGSGKWVWLHSNSVGEMASGTKDSKRFPFLLVPDMGDPEKAE